MDHFLNRCQWSRMMWKKGMECFGQTRRGPCSVQEKIQNWEEKLFKNAIVRRLWDMLPGFMAWIIWKEKNGRLFEGRTNTPEDVWKQTILHIIQSLGLHSWESTYLKASLAETRILTRWGINSIPAYIGPLRKTLDLVHSLEKGKPPPSDIQTQL